MLSSKLKTQQNHSYFQTSKPDNKNRLANATLFVFCDSARPDVDLEDYKIEWKRRTHVKTEPEKLDPVSEDDPDRVNSTDYSWVVGGLVDGQRNK